MATISEALAMALEHHQAGRLQAAEQIYRQMLQVEPNHHEALHYLGVIACMLGKHEVGIEYLRRALQVKPNDAEAHNNLGAALNDQGKLDEAIASYRWAVQFKPDFAQAHYNLGAALNDQGKLDEGIASYQSAVRLMPDFVEAHYNLGIAHKNQGKLDEAIGSYHRALQLRPDHAEAHNNLGNVLREQRKLDEAVAYFRRALAVNPNYADAHNNLGNALKDQGKFYEAVACYRQTLALRPHDVDAQCNLGVALSAQGNLEEGIACYRRTLALKPDHAEAHYNLGNALKDQGRLDEGVACYRRALALKPDHADAHNNLGSALREQGHFPDAVACFRRALSLKPDCADAHWNHANSMLLTGNFVRGWAEYEWRWQTKLPHFRRRDFSQPRWCGQPLAGKTILLYAEQGLGDTIQFVRYAALVKERGGHVVLECQPPLLPLLADCPGIDQIVAQGDPLPAFEVQAPLMSLPGILGTTLDSIPAPIPYLRVDPERTQSWRPKLERLGGFKVGIVWQGNPQHRSDRQRSLPLRHFEALARVEGVRLVSLQKGAGANQLATLAVSSAVLDIENQLATFRDTAAVLKSLDLVVSVDTAVAHVAGALGVPAWLALPFVPDWRWLLERADSPWYPHHRLFRQSRPGDWGEVFERVAAALGDLVAQGGSLTRTPGGIGP